LSQQAAQRVLIVAGLLLSLAGCAGRVERQVLRAYFDACALADDTALAEIALVTLDPRRDGVVGHFAMTGLSPIRLRLADAPTVVRLSLPPPLLEGATELPHLEWRDVDVQAELHGAAGVRDAELRVTIARARADGAIGRWIVVRLVLDGRILPAASSGQPSETGR
jgi:hypothetical protein